MTKEYTYTDSMPAHRFIERHLIRLMLQEMKVEGWVPQVFYNDDEDATYITSDTTGEALVEVWEAFTAVDSGILCFLSNRVDLPVRAWVKLIGGNGGDVINDYGLAPGVDEAMQRVFLK